MTLPSSGPISISQINAEFALGNSLSDYQGVTWYTDANATGVFATSPLSMSDFYGKRKYPNVTPGSTTITATGSGSFTVPAYNTLVIELWGGGGGSGSVVGTASGYNGTDGADTFITSLSLIAGGGKLSLGAGNYGVSAGGVGGTATGGNINTSGGNGGSPVNYNYLNQNAGGSSPNGGAGGAYSGAYLVNGNPGFSPGGGGGGAAYSNNSGTVGVSGGAGGGAYCKKTYALGTIPFGTGLIFSVGTGGRGGYQGANTGAAGAPGQIKFTWS